LKEEEEQRKKNKEEEIMKKKEKKKDKEEKKEEEKEKTGEIILLCGSSISYFKLSALQGRPITLKVPLMYSYIQAGAKYVIKSNLNFS
jgi:hypothetical protein